MFEPGEELLDRIQIRSVFRQIEEPGAGGTDGAVHSLDLVRIEIVHDHDVAGPLLKLSRHRAGRSRH
jgi:hypothetical protein